MFRRYIEPYENITPQELRRWKKADRYSATMWAGEDFWDEALRGDQYHRPLLRKQLWKRRKLKVAGKSFIGHELFCNGCGHDALIVTDDYGGVCSACEMNMRADKLNNDEEEFWASIGCSD